MAGSRVPGPLTEVYMQASIDDGTQPRVAMPGGGGVGSSSHAAVAPDARLQAAAASAAAATMDALGVLQDARVQVRLAATIQRGPMAVVHGIIVHQTDSSSASSTLESYKSKGANGAHFLIDKDGTVYQTASLLQRTWHVGKLRARCLLQSTCSAAEVKAYKKFDPKGMNKLESAKAVPDRYPSNEDSIGIELVGQALTDPAKPTAEPVYETVTDAQNASLKWLVPQLALLLSMPLTEVFRHPDVSWKNKTEASTAKWQ